MTRWIRGRTLVRLSSIASFALWVAPGEAQQLNHLPSRNDFSKDEPGDDLIFALEPRERAKLSVAASVSAAADFSRASVVEGASAGLNLYSHYELLISFRHLWLWRASGGSATFASIEGAWRLPLFPSERFVLRSGIEMGSSPRGLVEFFGRFHLELRMQVVPHWYVGAALLNPSVTVLRSTDARLGGSRAAWISGLDVSVLQ